MENPAISVIMSVYNEPVNWLCQSIDSIVQQSFSDFEFIIVCDNPSYKEGIDLLQIYAEQDKRIVILLNEENIGLTKSLNRAISVARGGYIARMDADDISLPQRFEKQYDYLCNHPEVTVLSSYAITFGEGIEENLRKDPVEHNHIARALPNECVMIHPAVMIRRGDFEIKYDENQKKSQDYELWLRLLSQGAKFHTLPEVLLKYRISANQISTKNRGQQQSDNRRARYITYRRVFKESGIEEYRLSSVKGSRNAYKRLCENGYDELKKMALFCCFYSIPHSFSHFIQLPVCSVKFGFSFKQSVVLFLSYVTKRWDCYHIEKLSSF